MFQSKALKEFTDEKRSKLYGWWVETTISKYYYNFVRNFITNPIFQVKRLLQWYWNVFRFDYDFDGHCLFAIIEYKLKRLQETLTNGHAIQEDQDMKALKLAIKLSGRLKEDKYDLVAYDRINKKYGESKIWFEDCNDGSGNSYMRSSRPKANTDLEKEQERNYTREQYNSCEYKRTREERILYAVLLKYLRRWWD